MSDIPEGVSPEERRKKCDHICQLDDGHTGRGEVHQYGFELPSPRQHQAWLGLATTRELLTEIKARGEVSHTIGEYPEEMGSMAIGAANLLDTLPGSMLDYRTVGRQEGDGAE